MTFKIYMSLRTTVGSVAISCRQAGLHSPHCAGDCHGRPRPREDIKNPCHSREGGNPFFTPFAIYCKVFYKCPLYKYYFSPAGKILCTGFSCGCPLKACGHDINTNDVTLNAVKGLLAKRGLMMMPIPSGADVQPEILRSLRSL